MSEGLTLRTTAPPAPSGSSTPGPTRNSSRRGGVPPESTVRRRRSTYGSVALTGSRTSCPTDRPSSSKCPRTEEVPMGFRA